MTIFAIMGTGKLAELESAIVDKYAGQFFKLNEYHWFIFDKVTSKEVSDKLEITSEGNTGRGEAVVLAVAGYWGQSNRQLWDWLASREAISNG